MIKIKLLEKTVQSASIPITWCIDKEWLDKHGTHCDVLFVTVPFGNGKEAEWRGKGKLLDLVGYVKFLRPGKNRIFCIAGGLGCKCLGLNWNVRKNGHWDDDVIVFQDGEPIITDYYVKANSAYVDVELPEDVFADEPPAWEKKWVNFFFSTRATDQCDFGRRRLLAYTIQPLLILLMMIVRWVVFLGALSSGARKLNPRPLFHITESIEWIWEEAIDPWITNKTKGTEFAPLGIFVPFAPTIIVLSIIFGLGIGPGIPVYICILLPIVVVSLAIIAFSVIGIIGTALNKKTSKSLIKDDIIKEQEYLNCTQNINTLKDLPKEKRSIKLKFNGIKSRVCAPFRR